ncbi:MAG: DinB family protein [Thermomicrobia bacterium]|nr:DinB family protein [Thermomicrobia bacterium]
MNATRWEADPYPDREETIERLRAEGERTAAVLSGLSEADLERTIAYGPIPAMSIAQLIERFVIGHPGRHLPGIRQELATSSRD